jgi:hypothetical protein
MSHFKSIHILALTIPTVLLLLILPPLRGRADDTGQSKPAVDLAAEREKYEASIQPLQKRYIARLETLQRIATQRGDLESALAIKQELERVQIELTGTTLLGKWAVEFNNGVTRTYVLKPEDTIHANGRDQPLTREGTDILLREGDGKTKRFSLRTVLFVEHWKRAQDYPDTKPAEWGVGMRLAE